MQENSLKMSQSGQKPGSSKDKSKADSFVWTDGKVELLLKDTIECKAKALRPRKMLIGNHARQRTVRYSGSFCSAGKAGTNSVTSSFWESSVLKTRKRRFQKFPIWRAFSKSCVFCHSFHRKRVDGRLIRKEKVAFSNENGYVWMRPNSFDLERLTARFVSGIQLCA